ncbi:unnamed protein product [Blepharisma stoltei]|uniref:START domain-containing protein n=1 Tax=Blepharisma stoltei TaxID=1481888 RepID=A0AAU9IGT7_9CILI|nr:unnamed protein product [Blepharisma stoltei]
MEAKVEEIKQLFRDDYLIQAHKKLTELEAELTDEEKLSLAEMSEARVIKDDLQMANLLLEHLSDLESWEPVAQEEDIVTFSKSTQSEVIVRGEMLLHQPITPLLALFSECDLLKNWVPILKDAKCLGQPSIFRRIIHYFFDLPWPVTNRDMVVSAVGVPIPENNSTLMIIRSIDQYTNFLGINIPAPEGIRITMDYACLNVTYLGPNESQISLIARCNPHMALIPTVLVNYVTKHGILYFLQSVREQCEKYEGSLHQQSVKANPAYYEEVVKRINIDILI